MSSSSLAAIRRANALSGDMDAVRALFLEYAAHLGIDLSFQDFESELARLPGCYAEPGGGLFLAVEPPGTTADNEAEDPAFPEIAGCVGFRELAAGICEMKRLYVRPAFQGMGLGKRLAQTVMVEARKAGYRAMRLDTLPCMRCAIALYERLGFSPIPPYRHNPIPGAVYYEATL